MDRAENINKSLKSVKRKKKNTPYPPQLRRRAINYIREQRSKGVSWNSITVALGLSSGTVKRWYNRDNETNQKTKKKDFVPVRIGSVLKGENGRGSSDLVFTTPGCYRVEGLNIDEVTVLLKVLA